MFCLPHSSVLEDGVILLRKRKEFPHDVVLLKFETEKKVNEGEYIVVHLSLLESNPRNPLLNCQFLPPLRYGLSRRFSAHEA